MRIALLGTRGIPNHYGGFEQFADILSQGLVQKGHDIFVYCSKNHPYTESKYKGVNLIHRLDPESKIGTVGQFIYDLVCMFHARNQKYDIVYLLGYTSSSIWQSILKNKTIVITNMDGLEWKRSKYSIKVQKFLKYAEKIAVNQSDYLVADSIGIQSYLFENYKVNSTYLPYGSYVFNTPSSKCLLKYNLNEYEYDILIARFEPENNIEMILDAFSKSTTAHKLILIGGYEKTSFGKDMYKKFSSNTRIMFLGAIYNQEELNNLRYYSNLYFHGHTVGGTNPSLLEAMGSNSLICYHNNEFNETIIGLDGFAFFSSQELTTIIDQTIKSDHIEKLKSNIEKIRGIYSWEIIINQYEAFFQSLFNKKHH